MWKVIRQDDNGVKYQMALCEKKAEAELIVFLLESHAHKNTFWAEEDGQIAFNLHKEEP